MNRLKGKTVLITGAAGGQGIAGAHLFASEGAALVLTDLNDDLGAALARDIRDKGGRALYLHQDVSEEDGWIRVVAETKAAFGGLHVLVNNAGISSRYGIGNVDRAAWDRTLAVNLTGPVLGMKHAAPLIRDSGGGSIINVSSIAGLMPHDDAAYTASKWGLRGLSKSAAIEFVDWKIRVNSVHPSQVSDTSFFREGKPGASEAARQTIPMQRQATPQECAQLWLFLASDEASYITGAEIAIDGGFSSGAAIWMRARLREQLARDEVGG